MRARFHELLHVLVVNHGFATPREFDLPTVVLTTEVRLAANVGRQVNVEPRAQKVPAFCEVAHGSGHFKVINGDD